ncbi:type III-A CRISPR-associated RAMP protein Csm3 [Zhenpiania hominis]|uniref:CRISPR system Cms endoribonuclease Csm3 n=1 Tax=Zhenpiania hominis TaxID=2763644 RepID=A0A923NIK4_9FIRM|nr:type III-A CRISPR-associated RAMP protein Csm3 [Zhenpiania hominis]MBC6679711.1 type III-A CRISPR-associated RAMP protein Csm3 [Zhenpiania hominis]
MFSKIEITGVIEVITGMHIGASDSFSAIGAIDTPVVRDPVSRLPIIPGSSLKGKMRSLLAKAYNKRTLSEHNDDDARIIRLFGASKGKEDGNPQRSRLIFSDAILNNKEELEELGADSVTEVKEENSINRISGVANPRQLERTIRGAKFPLSIIYDADDPEKVVEDFKVIADGLKLLQYDYIGGHGSRGYGKIQFKSLEADVVIGGDEVSDATIEACEMLLKEVQG